MLVPEFAAVLLPWWLLGIWLLPSLSVLWAFIGLYLIATQIALKYAKHQSRKDGYVRMIRLPVWRWVLCLLLRGRIRVPKGVPCYLLHVRTEDLRDARRLAREIEADVRRGVAEGGFYVGNTYSDLGRRALRLEPKCVIIVPGTFFAKWLQTWNVRADMQQRRLAGRIINAGRAWTIIAICNAENSGGSPTERSVIG